MGNDKSELREELCALRNISERLVAGLRPMVETQAVHTAILQSILAATMSPVEPDDDLAKTLAEIETAIVGQTAVLQRLLEILAPPVE